MIAHAYRYLYDIVDSELNNGKNMQNCIRTRMNVDKTYISTTCIELRVTLEYSFNIKKRKENKLSNPKRYRLDEIILK